MNTKIVTQTEPNANTLLASDPILHIRLFDEKGQWSLEVIFIGGSKVTGLLTADEVTALESDLQALGWQVDASLWSRGFNAKPPIEADELIFASSAGLWSDDYSIEAVAL